MYKIAIYGGAFNPPHAGHANVIIEASKQAESVLVVPSFKHPFGKVMMDYDLRLQWLHRITDRVRMHCEAEVSASDIERDLALKSDGPVFSYNLLSYASELYGVEPKQIALVVGNDVAEALPSFYLGPQLIEKFSIVTIPEQVGVRSTLMRQNLESGQGIPPHWMAPGLDPVDYKIYAPEVA
ncbi:adenylyltransferase/cytidyltransferase family protein [Pseudomonas putida]|uniref:nicotinate-nucleotide adenylyltransferase n=1 Tax=Pseudomonas putida TaxID=303 RepID=A0A8I1JHE9_PSEPU|nr:adenylyltransferase/cytidyltransferase family protein [Pseudomonas putida]MBI6882606.1 adenylyltransferase/cytidyltransferase family protein [Pseudomonas putida]